MKRTARMKLKEKYAKTVQRKNKLVRKYLPEEGKEEYNNLLKNQSILTEYLKILRFLDRTSDYYNEIEKEYEKIVANKNELVENYLPEKVKDKYYDLLAEQHQIEEYLSEHDDEYIEKDAKFDTNRCPICSFLDEHGRFEKSLYEAKIACLPCLIKDCPEYPDCWAVRSEKTPENNLEL